MASAQLRVVSLLPSATDLVALLLSKQRVGTRGAVELVGRSHECDWPAWLVSSVPMLTRARVEFTTPGAVDKEVREALSQGQSLYFLDEEKLAALKPDVVITQDLCEVCSIDLRSVTRVAMSLPNKPSVISLNPHTLEEVLASLGEVGAALGLEGAAKEAARELTERIQRSTAAATAPDARRPNVLFIEWPEPIFIGGHWTPQLIHNAGGVQRINADVGHKSFTVTDAAVVADDPDIVVVAPCGLTLDATAKVLHDLERDAVRGPWWKQLRAVREGRVYLVDGSLMFNRPSHHLVAAQEWLHWMLAEPTARAADRASQCPLKDFPWRPYALPREGAP